MMQNKNGWLRILEAFIAIILITSVLLVLYVQTINNPKKTEEVYRLQGTILEEIAFDPILRNAILKWDNNTVEDFVSKRVPEEFEFGIKICDINKICELESYIGKEGSDVYSSERIISANLTDYKPRKLKIFMWQK